MNVVLAMALFGAAVLLSWVARVAIVREWRIRTALRALQVPIYTHPALERVSIYGNEIESTFANGDKPESGRPIRGVLQVATVITGVRTAGLPLCGPTGPQHVRVRIGDTVITDPLRPVQAIRPPILIEAGYPISIEIVGAGTVELLGFELPAMSQRGWLNPVRAAIRRMPLAVAAAALAALMGCSGCQPGPPAPQPPPTLDQTIYGELVEAGCLAPDPATGVSSVASEHAMPDQPAWLACLYDGGTIAGCNVPCQ